MENPRSFLRITVCTLFLGINNYFCLSKRLGGGGRMGGTDRGGHGSGPGRVAGLWGRMAGVHQSLVGTGAVRPPSRHTLPRSTVSAPLRSTVGNPSCGRGQKDKSDNSPADNKPPQQMLGNCTKILIPVITIIIRYSNGKSEVMHAWPHDMTPC